MSRIFKIFLIFLYAVFSLGISSYAGLSDYTAVDRLTLRHEVSDENILINSYNFSDTVIVSSNNNLCEICASKSDKDFGYGIFEKSLSDSKILNEKSRNYIFKVLNSKSHNISPLLVYEICTRAP